MTLPHVVVATTLAPFVMDQQDYWGAWLYNAETLRERAAAADIKVTFFAAIEHDARGKSFMEPLKYRLDELGGDYWWWTFDDHHAKVTTGSRQRRVAVGQNLCKSYMLEEGASHLLFMAADCRPEDNAILKLLDMRWPIVGGEVSTYCLKGEPVSNRPGGIGAAFGYPVETHMATAAFVMVERELLKKIHFRFDPEHGWSDDMSLYMDAKALGFPTLVRKDCIGTHYPMAVSAIETRIPGRDMNRYPLS